MADNEYDNPDLNPGQIYYNWAVPLPPTTGDTNISISGSPVTTINGLSGPTIVFGGGTSGFSYSTTAPSTITLVSPLTTKGDLYTWSTLGIRLAVGANGRVLTANSATATGLEWATTATASALDVTTITSAASPYSLSDTNDVLLVDASGGAVTVNLHTAATAKQKPYYIKKIDSSVNAMTLDGSGAQVIDGAATQVTTVQYVAYAIVPNNTTSAWSIV